MDSLLNNPDTISIAPVEPVRAKVVVGSVDTFDSLLTVRSSSDTVSLFDIMGPHATLLTTERGSAMAKKSTNYLQNAYDIIMILVIVVIYTRLIYLHKNLIPTIFKAEFYSYSATTLMDSFDVNVTKFIKWANVMFILSVSLFVYSLCIDTFSDAPAIVRSNLLPGVALLMLMYILWRKTTNAIIRNISGNSPFFDKIEFNNSLTFSFWAIIFTPLVLASAFAPSPLFYSLRYIMIAVLSIAVLQHTVELFRLFLKQKVSFIQYILYFCTVELLPISFVIVLTYKKISLF